MMTWKETWKIFNGINDQLVFLGSTLMPTKADRNFYLFSCKVKLTKLSTTNALLSD